MDEFKDYDMAAPVKNAKETADKAVMAGMTAVGTWIGTLIADTADAAGWVFQAIVIAGGAASAGLVYWKQNRPKR